MWCLRQQNISQYSIKIDINNIQKIQWLLKTVSLYNFL